MDEKVSAGACDPPVQWPAGPAEDNASFAGCDSRSECRSVQHVLFDSPLSCRPPFASPEVAFMRTCHLDINGDGGNCLNVSEIL